MGYLTSGRMKKRRERLSSSNVKSIDGDKLGTTALKIVVLNYMKRWRSRQYNVWIETRKDSKDDYEIQMPRLWRGYRPATSK